MGVGRRAAGDAPAPELDERVSADALPGILGRADYVVASLPLTTRTRASIDEQAFRAMKRSAIFVNVGRGKTVDEVALTRALQEGWIGAATLDVFEQEPLPAGSLLWGLPNVLIVRPERLELGAPGGAPGDNRLAGRVERVAFSGATVSLEVRLATGRVITVDQPNRGPADGLRGEQPVTVVIPPDALRVLPGRTG